MISNHVKRAAVNIVVKSEVVSQPGIVQPLAVELNLRHFVGRPLDQLVPIVGRRNLFGRDQVPIPASNNSSETHF